jgi:hypothetical protein
VIRMKLMRKLTWKGAFRFLNDVLDEKFLKKHIAKYLYRVLLIDDEENVPKEIIVADNTFGRFSPFYHPIKKGEKIPYANKEVMDEDGYKVNEAKYGIILDIYEKLPNPNWPNNPMRLI